MFVSFMFLLIHSACLFLPAKQHRKKAFAGLNFTALSKILNASEYCLFNLYAIANLKNRTKREKEREREREREKERKEIRNEEMKK